MSTDRRISVPVALGYALTAIALALGILLIGIPGVTGGAALTVLTGSMSPTIPAGSVVVVQPKDPAEIAVGDVITFQPELDAMYVTHRVIEVGHDASGNRMFFTQGDANPTPDQNPVAAAGVAGVVNIHIPHLGHATSRINGRMGLVGVALVLAFLFVSSQIKVIRGELRGRDRDDDIGGGDATPEELLAPHGQQPPATWSVPVAAQGWSTAHAASPSPTRRSVTGLDEVAPVEKR